MHDELRPCPNCGSSETTLRYEKPPPFRVVECVACGVVYLANPPEADQLYEEYYRGGSPVGTAYRAGTSDPALAELHAINEQRIEAVKERSAPGKTLLDVGCGRGYFLETAQRHGFQATGIDISERAVAQARSAFAVEARVGTVSELAAASSSFHVITLWHVLEHFLDPFEAVRQVSRLLAPGGHCFVEVPNLRSLKFILTRGRWEGGNHPRYHRTFFTSRTLRRALLENGFSEAERLKLSYQIPGRSRLYEVGKRLTNQFALDAFLTFVARK